MFEECMIVFRFWYISKCYRFLKSVLSFFRFWYINKCYRFLKSVLSFFRFWYISKCYRFLKSVLSFFRFWYISKCYRFLKSVLSFSKPQVNFKKIKMSRILLSINLNFGCSSFDNIWIFFKIYIYIYIYWAINMILNHHWADVSNIGLKYGSVL